MNRVAKGIIYAAGAMSGLYAARRMSTRQSFRIVTYHGVDGRHDPVVNFDRLQTDPAWFERQLVALARRFRIVSLRAAVLKFMADSQWPERALAITFDDGYLNNLEVAAPVLARLGLPATFFVTAGFIDGRAKPWWYALRGHLARRAGSNEAQKIAGAVRLEAKLRPLSEAERAREMASLGVDADAALPYPFMTREDCRALIAMGFDVQCHGDTHASLYGESSERVTDEIRLSAAFITQLGHTPWALAYPYGHEPRDAAHAAMVMRAHGLFAALTTREQANGRDASLWSLGRFDLHGGYSVAGAVAKLS